MQSLVVSQMQHWRLMPVRPWQGGGHAFGHQVVTPSQVTCPCSPASQFRSADEQLLTLALLEQETLPVSQIAVASQRDFPVTAAGCLAAWR